MILAFLSQKQFASNGSHGVSPMSGLLADCLLPPCSKPIRGCSGIEMKISDRRRRSNATLVKIKAGTTHQTINKHNHIPNIRGPHSFAVLIGSVTWRGESHANTAPSMFGRLVAIKRY
jgi:hypothetical protein